MRDIFGKFKKGHKGFAGMKGKKHSNEAKLKMSIIQKNNGNIPPSRKGIKVSEETKNKISKKLKGEKRPKFSNEWKEKLSNSHKGKQTWSKGKKFSEEYRKKLSEAHINSKKFIFKDTSIELKVEEELKKRNINYQKQVPLCKIARVDFYLPEYRIVIQCDGDYWHNLPDHKKRDEQQDKVLLFNGFNVYRFWEYEINKSVKECINRINFGFCGL